MNAEPGISIVADSVEELTKQLKAANPPVQDLDILEWSIKQKERFWFCRFLSALPEGELFPAVVLHSDGPDFIVEHRTRHTKYGIEVTELVSGGLRAKRNARLRPHHLPHFDPETNGKEPVEPVLQWGEALKLLILKKTEMFGWASIADQCWLLVVDSWHESSRLMISEMNEQLEEFAQQYWQESGRPLHRIYVDSEPQDAGRVIFEVRDHQVTHVAARDYWSAAQ